MFHYNAYNAPPGGGGYYNAPPGPGSSYYMAPQAQGGGGYYDPYQGQHVVQGQGPPAYYQPPMQQVNILQVCRSSLPVHQINSVKKNSGPKCLEQI